MGNTVLERVVEVVKYSNLSKRAFAEKINMEQSTVNNQILGKRSISFDLIQNIAKTFEALSLDWLVTGKGEMLRTMSADSSAQIRALEDEIVRIKAENNLLREQAGLRSTNQRNAG